MNPIDTIIQGDALEVLKTLPDNYVDCCITSPPYWGLRDYNVDGQIGLEDKPEKYIENLRFVFREVWRCLKPSRNLWLNLGDSYDAIIERQQEALDGISDSSRPTVKPEERQSFINALSEQAERIRILEEIVEKQTHQINDLIKAKSELQDGFFHAQGLAKDALKEEIERLQGLVKDLDESMSYNFREDRKRLTVLERRSSTAEDKTVNTHLDGLYGHMKAIGKKQVSFREAAKILEISKQRLHQFKSTLALDKRFIIISSQSHKQKEMIRLREYDKNS